MDYRGFLLRPDIPPEGIPRPESYNRPNSPLKRYADEAGLPYNRPGVIPYTRLALEATEYAKREGKEHEFHWAAYRAYWGDGVDLGKTDVIRDIARGVGLDWAELSGHLERRSFQGAIEQQYAEAIRLGVTGIPAYVIGRFFFMGAQPYELFVQVAERALQLIETSAQQGEGTDT